MNWKAIVYFVVAGVVLIGGLGAAVYLGLQPRSVPKINLSHFEKAEEAGAAAAQRLWLELKAADILLLGVWPEHPEGIDAVKGVLSAMKDSPYDIVVVEKDLKNGERLGAAQVISVRSDLPGFVEGVKVARAQGRRVAAVLPSLYASQLIADGPARRLKAELGSITSISLAPFPRSRDEEEKFPVKCETGERHSIGALGCAVLHKARVIYRKKKDPRKFAATLDLVGESDYLFLLSPPKSP